MSATDSIFELMTFDAYKQLVALLEQSILKDIFMLQSEDWERSKLYHPTEQNKLLHEIAENINRVRNLENDLLTELDLNEIESNDKTQSYKVRLESKLNEKSNELIQLLKGLDIQNRIPNLNDDYILDYVSTTLHELKKVGKFYEMNFLNLIYILAATLINLKQAINDYEIAIESPETVQDSGTKVLYLHFSGIMQKLRESLSNPSNRKLAETIAFLSNEKANNITVLLSQLGHITLGKPHRAFTKAMIEAANIQLEKDGFSSPILDGILLKMDVTN